MQTILGYFSKVLTYVVLINAEEPKFSKYTYRRTYGWRRMERIRKRGEVN